MALISPSISIEPSLARSAYQPSTFGTIPNNVAAGIFGRQSQKDLDECVAYCNRKWPGHAGCIEACRESSQHYSQGIADSSDFFAGAVYEPTTIAPDVTDLYNQVAVPDWATNTGINPGGTVVRTPVVSPKTDAPQDNSSLLIASGVALAAIAAWIIFSK